MRAPDVIQTTPPRFLRYCMAAGSVTVMALVRLLLNGWMEEQSRFILFLPAVMMTSLYGGLNAALVALMLGAGVGVYFFVLPLHGHVMPTIGDIIGLFLYVMAGLMIALVNEMQRSAQERAERSREATERARELLAEHHLEIEALNLRLRRAMLETYHRVKNNLQVVAALVGITLQDERESIPRAEFERIQQHVLALSSINDLLTQQVRDSAEDDGLAADTVLDRLMSILPSTIGDRRLHCVIDSVRMSVKQNTALTLLANELVSNAIKHGKGDIDFSLAVEGDTVRMVVCDDGAGFSPEFDPRASANTGLDLIDSLVRLDLEGKAIFDNAPQGGGRVTIIFPLCSARASVHIPQAA